MFVRSRYIACTKVNKQTWKDNIKEDAKNQKAASISFIKSREGKKGEKIVMDR